MFYDLFKNYTELTAEDLSSSCFINDGKGHFKKMILPNELQLAPVMCFAPGNTTSTWFGAGNFYGVTPYEGRYDALQPTMFSFDKKSSTFGVQSIMPGFNGEVRDAKWVNYADGSRVLVVARNNGPLAFLKLKSQ